MAASLLISVGVKPAPTSTAAFSQIKARTTSICLPLQFILGMLYKIIPFSFGSGIYSKHIGRSQVPALWSKHLLRKARLRRSCLCSLPRAQKLSMTSCHARLAISASCVVR